MFESKQCKFKKGNVVYFTKNVASSDLYGTADYVFKKGDKGIVCSVDSLFGINLYAVANGNRKVIVLEDELTLKNPIQPKVTKQPQTIEKSDSVVCVANKFKDKLIIAITPQNGEPLVGVAKCNPEDKFDYKTGLVLSIARAFKDKRLEEFILNGYEPVNKLPNDELDALAYAIKANNSASVCRQNSQIPNKNSNNNAKINMIKQ